MFYGFFAQPLERAYFSNTPPEWLGETVRQCLRCPRLSDYAGIEASDLTCDTGIRQSQPVPGVGRAIVGCHIRVEGEYTPAMSVTDEHSSRARSRSLLSPCLQ
jgi:hypothetical protein